MIKTAANIKKGVFELVLTPVESGPGDEISSLDRIDRS